MRRGLALAPLAAVALLLTGCHQYWGGSSSSGGGAATYGPEAGAAQAQANVRAAIPAIEAWYADNGTYAGATVELIQERYDAGVKGVRFVEPFNRNTYCVESTVVQATYHKQGPTADIQEGHCGANGRPVASPPPVSYDPVTNLRMAIPAIEAWNADHGTYGGMTVRELREKYDYGIPDIDILKATRTTYCIESTVGDLTASKNGPAVDIVKGRC